MILITGRDMQIPSKENCIGYIGDNKTEIREFKIIDPSLFALDFKLDLQCGTQKGIVDLTKTTYDDEIILKWEIKEEHMPSKGMIFAQLRAFDNTDLKWHSETVIFTARDSINATEQFPSPLPSEFSQLEQLVTDAKNEAVAAKDITLSKANEVELNTQTVSENTTAVVQKAVEVAENTIEVEENKSIAQTSAKTASQALSDLLAMLGTNIATLTGGKLTPSQIPAIAVTDTFVVNSESAMLALTAQTGDVCIRTDESKTYILQGNEPSILGNWQQMQTPDDFAATANYAVTAGNAENADKINGHRVVVMTQAQYDAAIKDPDTVYLLGV